MSLLPLVGHEELKERLGGAVHAGQLPQSLLLHGPTGIGKQRLALWLAELLLCERQTGCGTCTSCRLGAQLQHPDIHWHFPVARPRASANLKRKLEESRLKELDQRRDDPLRVREEKGATGIYLAAVENIRAAAIRRPAMGERQVFVIGQAETMVPQEGKPEAANAFLKLLEEPPERVHLFLTSDRPGALLPTVLSRVLSIRVSPLSDEEVATFLSERTSFGQTEAAVATRRAQGSIGAALRILSTDTADRYGDAERFLLAATSARREDRIRFALSVAPHGARQAFLDLLEAVSELLRDQICLATGADAAAFDEERARRLGKRRLAPDSILRALGLLEEAERAAATNVNPQALTASLLVGVARELSEPAVGRPRPASV